MSIMPLDMLLLQDQFGASPDNIALVVNWGSPSWQLVTAIVPQYQLISNQLRRKSMLSPYPETPPQMIVKICSLRGRTKKPPKRLCLVLYVWTHLIGPDLIMFIRGRRLKGESDTLIIYSVHPGKRHNFWHTFLFWHHILPLLVPLKHLVKTMNYM